MWRHTAWLLAVVGAPCASSAMESHLLFESGEQHRIDQRRLLAGSVRWKPVSVREVSTRSSLRVGQHKVWNGAKPIRYTVSLRRLGYFRRRGPASWYEADQFYGKSVVDGPCGTNHFIADVLPLVGPSGSARGIDIIRFPQLVAPENFDELDLGKLIAVSNQTVDLFYHHNGPFRPMYLNQEPDVVVSGMLREAARVLRASGKLRVFPFERYGDMASKQRLWTLAQAAGFRSKTVHEGRDRVSVGMEFGLNGQHP